MNNISRFYILLLSMLQLGVLAAKTDSLDNFSIGVGNLTKYVGKIQTDIDGSRNYISFNPFVRGIYRRDFFWENDWVKKINFEAGLTLPKSGADDAVTVTNFWLQALLEHPINIFRLQAGFGLFFTYTSMDGQTQVLGNGTSTQEFYTPDDVQTAVNNIFLLGSDIIINNDFYTNLQLSIFNIEDGDERAFSYALSLNYNLGN